MSLQILDPKTSAAISRLKQDIDSPEYRTILIENPNASKITTIVVNVADAEIGAGDASYLGSRSIINMSYDPGSGPVTAYLGVSPYAILPSEDGHWDGLLINGPLQISSDTFTWYGRLSIGDLAEDASEQIYIRFKRPTYGSTMDLNFTLTNKSGGTIYQIVLTATGSDLLSLDGNTYQTSISVGTLPNGSSTTIYLRSASIDLGKIYPAELDITSSAPALSLGIDAVGLNRFYTTVDEIKDWLNSHVADTTLITSDEELRDLIKEASRQIDRVTRRHFDLQSTTERYDGTGQQKLVLENYPIIGILEVQIYNANNQLITDIKKTDSNFATELIIDYVLGFITLPPASPPLAPYPYGTPYYWPWSTMNPALLSPSQYDYSTRFGVGTSNVVVTYTHGYQIPPEPIRRAAMKMVIIELLRKRGAADSQGVATRTIAGATVTYATRGGASGGSGPYGHLIDELDTDVQAVMQQYVAKRLRVI
jgi:hypothetical protein